MTEPADHFTRTLCVLGDPERPHSAHVGYLCDAHMQKLSATLRSIEDEYAILSTAPALGVWSTGGHRGLAHERTPVVIDALALADNRTRPWEPADDTERTPARSAAVYGPFCHLCTHDSCLAYGSAQRAARQRDTGDDEADVQSNRLLSVEHELHNWARTVREERDLAAPERVTISGERALLTKQLDWIAAQPWVDELNRDLTAVLESLRGVNRTGRGKDDGACPVFIDGLPCTGRVRRSRGAMPWVVRDDRCEVTPVDVEAGVLTCTDCGTTWATPADEARLHAIRADDARDALGMLTAAGLSVRLGITKRAAQERLKRNGAKPVMNGGVGWYPADILDQPVEVSA